jgi:hypothetical protein
MGETDWEVPLGLCHCLRLKEVMAVGDIEEEGPYAPQIACFDDHWR